jgi:DNA-directed RNA polymerase sigma subunit (sigma70/sigma32)
MKLRVSDMGTNGNQARSRRAEERYFKALALKQTGMTHKEVGEILGVSKDRARQLCIAAKDRFVTRYTRHIMDNLHLDFDMARDCAQAAFEMWDCIDSPEDLADEEISEWARG